MISWKNFYFASLKPQILLFGFFGHLISSLLAPFKHLNTVFARSQRVMAGWSMIWERYAAAYSMSCLVGMASWSRESTSCWYGVIFSSDLLKQTAYQYFSLVMAHVIGYQTLTWEEFNILSIIVSCSSFRGELSSWLVIQRNFLSVLLSWLWTFVSVFELNF